MPFGCAAQSYDRAELLIQVTRLRALLLNDERTFKEPDMKANVGTIDRILRTALGLGLIAVSLLGYIGAWGWIGLLPLATGIFGFCPAYWSLGLSTCTTGTGSAKS